MLIMHVVTTSFICAIVPDLEPPLEKSAYGPTLEKII